MLGPAPSKQTNGSSVTSSRLPRRPPERKAAERGRSRPEYTESQRRTALDAFHTATRYGYRRPASEKLPRSTAPTSPTAYDAFMFSWRALRAGHIDNTGELPLRHEFSDIETLNSRCLVEGRAEGRSIAAAYAYLADR